jgi:hypothetical protein
MSRLEEKLREALKAGRSGQVDTKSPFQRFGFSQDPFLMDVDFSDPAFLVAREDVLLNFARQVGNAIRLFEENPTTPFRHLLVHGLQGCGKSFLARHFHREWDQIGFQDYDTFYVDLSAWREPLDVQELLGASTLTFQTYEQFLRQIQLVEQPLIIFVDSLDYTITGTSAIPRFREFLAEILKQAQHGVIIIGFMQSLTLAALSEPDQVSIAHSLFAYFNPQFFFFPVFSRSEIIQLITQRIRLARSPIEIFTPRVIEIIAEHSLGIPTVALQLASDCLHELVIHDLNKVTVNTIEPLIRRLGYDTVIQLVNSLESDSDEEEITSLITPKRREIIALILSHQHRERFFFPATSEDGLRSSSLADELGVSNSTMNYHLKPLTTTFPLPILETIDDMRDARSKIYTVNWKSPIPHWKSFLASVLEVLTVYHRLKPRRYDIKPSTILLARREHS